jgi:hypothetical protein
MTPFLGATITEGITMASNTNSSKAVSVLGLCGLVVVVLIALIVYAL